MVYEGWILQYKEHDYAPEHYSVLTPRSLNFLSSPCKLFLSNHQRSGGTLLMEHRCVAGIGSMGLAKPIIFQRWVLEPSIFEEVQQKFTILTLMDTKAS